MRGYLFIIVLLNSVFSANILFAQNYKNESSVLHRLDLFSPGYELEYPVSKNIFISCGIKSDLALSGRFGSTSESFVGVEINNKFRDLSLDLIPYLESGLRWRYKQKIDGQKNEGNYIKLAGRYYWDKTYLNILSIGNKETIKYNGFKLSVIWGSRNFKKERFIIDYYFGLESGINAQNEGLRILLGLRFGIPLIK